VAYLHIPEAHPGKQLFFKEKFTDFFGIAKVKENFV